MLLLVPICGLVCQPIIGSYSDRYGSIIGSRTPFLLIVCITTAISSYLFSWGRETSAKFLPGSDPENLTGAAALLAKIFVVFGIVGSGISQDINNACSRSLVVEKVSFDHQSLVNAVAGISGALGSLMSYAVCAMDLPELIGTNRLDQLQLLSIITVVITLLTIIVTIITANEGSTKKTEGGKWDDPLRVIYYTIKKLPKPIRAVCNIQFFSSLPWYPVLFFSSIWVEENTFSAEAITGTDGDRNGNMSNARVASIPLVVFSLSSLIAGLLMPMITPLGYLKNRRKSKFKNYLFKLYNVFAYLGNSVPKVWAFSHLLLFVVLCFTPIRISFYNCLVIMAVLGYAWGIAQWIPFAIISELLIKLKNEPPNLHLYLDSFTETTTDGKTPAKTTSHKNEIIIDNGAILGVHNIYIVAPQLISAFISLGVTHYVDTQFRATGMVSSGWCMLACSPGALVAAYLILKNIPEIDKRYELFKNESVVDSGPMCARIFPPKIFHKK